MNEPLSRIPSLPGRALALLHRVEDLFLAALLAAMVLLAPLQILLRLGFDEGLIWADPLLRVLVLWVGLAGAVSASRGNRHISIDVLSRFAPPRVRAGVGVVTSLFTAGVSGLVAWHAGRFVAESREFHDIAFSGIEAWIFQVVMPLAFGLIAIRYVLYTGHDAAVALGLRPPEPPPAEPIQTAPLER
jgi:TRAP-type C4-dicarboxylate transport system permease small subunit